MAEAGSFRQERRLAKGLGFYGSDSGLLREGRLQSIGRVLGALHRASGPSTHQWNDHSGAQPNYRIHKRLDRASVISGNRTGPICNLNRQENRK